MDDIWTRIYHLTLKKLNKTCRLYPDIYFTRYANSYMLELCVKIVFTGQKKN
jgi:hypothetical protein